MPSVDVAASVRCADDQINTVGDFVHGLADIVALVGEKQREMRRNIAKGPYSEHAPDIDQIAVAKNAPERRHGQRQAQGEDEEACDPEAPAHSTGVVGAVDPSGATTTAVP